MSMNDEGNKVATNMENLNYMQEFVRTATQALTCWLSIRVMSKENMYESVKRFIKDVYT